MFKKIFPSYLDVFEMKKHDYILGITTIGVMKMFGRNS